MEKKNLKWYEAPVMEVVEMKSAVSLLAGSSTGNDSNVPGAGDGDNVDDLL